MMPRVDLPELLMDVHAMTGCFDEFSHYALADRTAGTRMEDLAISLAAVFVAEGCNLGFTPVIKAGHPALTRTRRGQDRQDGGGHASRTAEHPVQRASRRVRPLLRRTAPARYIARCVQDPVGR